MAMSRIRSFIDNSLKTVTTPLQSSGERNASSLEPEVGIRIVYSPEEKKLRVTVLGARHLPQNFFLTRVNSYVVKLKLIPGKDHKFETTTRNESWPQWNEEFVFPLRKETKSKFGKTKVVEEEIGGHRFIVATLYAILEDKPLIATEKKENEKENKAVGTKDNKKEKKDKKGRDGGTSAPAGGSSAMQQEAPPATTKTSGPGKLLGQFYGKDKIAESAGGERKGFQKRQTVGATTIPLDMRNFTMKPNKPKHPHDVSTGDMWRTLKPISSGIAGSDERRQNKKGSVEIALCQEKSDKKDVSGGRLVLTLMKLRCSLQTMHEHEELKGHMYIKMSVVDAGKVTHFWKSNRFDPCVTMKFDEAQAQVAAENPYEGALKDVSFVVKFVCKNKLGKKVTVGHFVIGPDVGGSYSEQWKMALAKPGQQIVKVQPFE